MSTIYTFHRECASLATPATGDRIMTADISDNASHPTAQDMTLAIVKSAARGTATCLTALTTNPTFSASNTGAGVFGFSSSTVATAYVTRIQQMQVDFDTLMGKINSTGLVNITGL
jgi:ABC-type amino acid transport substrate-binding protein